jgi:hypothetical protein
MWVTHKSQCFIVLLLLYTSSLIWSVGSELAENCAIALSCDQRRTISLLLRGFQLLFYMLTRAAGRTISLLHGSGCGIAKCELPCWKAQTMRGLRFCLRADLAKRGRFSTPRALSAKAVCAQTTRKVSVWSARWPHAWTVKLQKKNNNNML